MLAQRQQLRLSFGDRRRQAGAAFAAAHTVFEYPTGRRQARLFVRHQTAEQAALQVEILLLFVRLARRHLEHVQRVQLGLARQQAMRLMQGGTGALREVQRHQRPLIRRDIPVDGQQQRNAAAARQAFEGGAGEQLGARLVMGAQHQQVGADALRLAGDGGRRLALGDAQLGARQAQGLQALTQRLRIGFPLLHMQQGQATLQLAGQLGGALQGQVGLRGQVVGDENVHGEHLS